MLGLKDAKALQEMCAKHWASGHLRGRRDMNDRLTADFREGTGTLAEH